VAAAGTPRDIIDAYTNASYAVVSDEEAGRITQMEHGRVTRHMEIVAADLRDADGRPARSFLAGAAATVTVRTEARRDVRDPIIGITVRNSAGTIVYETNTSLHKVSVGDVAAGGAVVVSFPLRLHLCHDAYSVTAGIAPSAGTVLLDWRENLAQFDVFSGEPGIGIADLQSSIHIHTSSTVDEEADGAGGADGADAPAYAEAPA